MINRIRDIRAQKGMTLAQVAAACDPPTTAQTIGRLETGMRNLSLVWMNRIATALQVEPELLLRSEGAGGAQVTAVLTPAGVDAPAKATDALLPTALGGESGLRVVTVEGACGDYSGGDQIWLRDWPLDDLAPAQDREVLAPLPDGGFAFGRLSHHAGDTLTITPPGSDETPIKVTNPAWLAIAEMLVRKL